MKNKKILISILCVVIFQIATIWYCLEIRKLIENKPQIKSQPIEYNISNYIVKKDKKEYIPVKVSLDGQNIEVFIKEKNRLKFYQSFDGGNTWVKY